MIKANFLSALILVAICQFSWGQNSAIGQSLPEVSSKQGEHEELGDAVDNPFFSAADLLQDGQDESRAWWEFDTHGRLDFTSWFYQDSRNVDASKRRFTNALNSALALSWDRGNWEAALELEFEGEEAEIELDQLYVRAKKLIPFVGDFAIGKDYIPFGIERRFYAANRNPFVNRPAVFRRAYPGSYSDWGVFVQGRTRKRKEALIAQQYQWELAISRALRGPERGDRAETGFNSSDDLQYSGHLDIDISDHLSIGCSGLIGSYQEFSRHFKQYFIGANLFWKGKWKEHPHWLRLEYVSGRAARSVVKGGNLRRDGLYVELYHKHLVWFEYMQAVELAFRFDKLNDNLREQNFRDLRRYSVGINWVYNERARLKFQYEINDEKHHEITNNAFLVQISYAF